MIKGWLPAAGVKKIKFLSKSTMGDYVTEGRLIEWGGDDPWEYKFEPGLDAVAADASNNNQAPSTPSMKVDLQEQQNASPGNFTSSGTGLLRLTPGTDVVFDKNSYGDLVARLTISNASSQPVVYKIKTTSPDRYKVRPSMYNLPAESSNQVEILVQSQSPGLAASLVRDKFLITAVTVDQEGLTTSRIAEIMKVKCRMQ